MYGLNRLLLWAVGLSSVGDPHRLSRAVLSTTHLVASCGSTN